MRMSEVGSVHYLNQKCIKIVKLKKECEFRYKKELQKNPI